MKHAPGKLSLTQSIILQGQGKAGGSGFYRIDAATGEAVPIMEKSGMEASSTMETGEEKEIFRIPDSHRVQMRLSPDGRRLAGIHWKRPLGVNTLFTLGPDGGEPR